MSQQVYWTAKLFIDGEPKERKHFALREERDAFVAEHEGWKKRGKICTENLKRYE